ncbi:MAG: 5-methylcytosine restriction system specificity protein McrC [Myxococcota bacterium]
MIAYENESIDFSSTDRDHIRNLIGGHLERREDGWAICRLVGHIALPSGGTLFIRSRKAPSAALCAWLAYVDPALQGVRFHGQDVEAEESGELSAIVARAYVDEIVRIVRLHGLNRHYRRVHVRTGTVRGAIDFPKLVRAGGELSRMPCVAWERLPQTPVNRTLAAAVDRVRRDSVLRRACRAKLPEAVSVLSDVEPLADRRLLDGRAALSRSERHLDRALALARLLLRSTGFQEGRGDHGGAFLVNLESLFERTVAKAFQEVPIGARAKAPVYYLRESANGTVEARSMEMDVFIPASRTGSIVIDAKYKTSVASSNLQQMVTYCFVTGSSSAVLVFPEGFVSPGTAYRFSGRSGESSSPMEIEVSTAELETGGNSVEEWRAAARRLAVNVLGPTLSLDHEGRVSRSAGRLGDD